jgi:hypothetical protein
MTLRDSKGRYVRQSATPVAKPTPAASKVKNYFGISRDHSASMRFIAGAAAKAYNSNIKAIQEASAKENQDTIVSVVKCGVGPRGEIVREVVNSTVSKLVPLVESAAGYVTDGHSTPLFNSVLDLIDQLESVPDAKDPNVSFVIEAITDGEDNSSGYGAAQRLTERMRKLQSTDHWTFVFRVPVGGKRVLITMGIPEGNILEWEQTTRGVEVAARTTEAAYGEYFSARTKGMTATRSFYTTDLSGVKSATVKSKLVDISKDVEFFNVGTHAGEQIRDFVEYKTGRKYVTGSAFYQLTKKEDEVQDYKQIALRDKKSGAVYSGANAREMLGLPYNGTVKVVPGNHGTFDIFIQSTSVNRKLKDGTQVMVWNKV